MSLGDRLGWAGIILAFVGIAISTIWPTERWIGWLAVFAAIGLCICWLALEFRTKTPSFVFVFGVPLGDNKSSVWLMMLKHYGPDPAYNCRIEFFDKDRKSIEHEWLVQHPNSPYPPPGLAGESQKSFHIAEAGPSASAGSFQWLTLDPDQQHYSASITCRDGVFQEEWEITRVDGVLRSKITLWRRPERAKKNSRVVFECADPEFQSTPLALAMPAIKPHLVHPGWKPKHRFEVPVAIIDPNNQIQIVSAIKLPDGSEKKDFGCWNLSTEHRGGKR